MSAEFSILDLGFDVTQPNPGPYRTRQIEELTSLDESKMFTSQYANGMSFGELSSYGGENLGLVNQRVQFFHSKASSNEKKTLKSEKKKKRKKNAVLRRAIEKQYYQDRQQELEVERCQVLFAATNQQQMSTETHNLIDHQLYIKNTMTHPEARAKQALNQNGKLSGLRQPRMSLGASAKENTEIIKSVSNILDNRDLIISQESSVMAEEKTKDLLNPSRKRRRGKDPDETNPVILKSANKNGYFLSKNEGNISSLCNKADDLASTKLNENNAIGYAQVSGKEANLVNPNEEKQNQILPTVAINNQESTDAKGKDFSYTNPKKKRKKAVKQKSNLASLPNKTQPREINNLNHPKNIPVIGLSSPVFAKNVLSGKEGTKNNCSKKKRPARSKKKSGYKVTAVVTVAAKAEELKRSNKVNKKARKQRISAEKVTLSDGNNPINVRLDRIEISDENGSQHENKKMKHGEQGELKEQEKLVPNIKQIPGYLKPYKTDTEKEVLSLMRELLGIVG